MYAKALLENNRTIRFKVIRAVYEKLTIKEVTEEYAAKSIINVETVYEEAYCVVGNKK